MSLNPQDLEQILLETQSPQLRDTLRALIEKVNAIDDRQTPVTESFGTLAAQPSLGAGDAGFIYNVTDYNHRVRWDGSAWDWAPGDPGNNRIELFADTPQGDGWQLCDGTATDFLTLGATLTATAYTTPNLATAAYLKAGTAAAAVAAASGQTDTVADHQHGLSGASTNTSFENQASTTVDQNLDGLTVGVARDNHDHDVDHYDTPTGAAGGHFHTPNTLELRRVTYIAYFRR